MKIASRFLLPLELFSAVLMLSWGVSGWLGGGQLWNILSQHGLNAEWGLWLCGMGAAQLAAAGVEGSLGRHWEPSALLRSVRCRFWAAFGAIATWLYVCFLLLTLRGAVEVFVLLMQAPSALVACVLIVMGNSRVACVLDPAVSTHNLQTRILRERRRGWSAEEEPLIRGPH